MELGNWVFVSVCDLSQDLVAILSQSHLYIRHLLLNYVNKERCDFVQKAIIHIIVPCAAKDSIVGLADKVVADVVDNDCFF